MTSPDHSTEYRDPNARSNGPSEPGSGSAPWAGTVRDGLVGGVVALLLSVVPLSTVLGGAIAGYLDADGGRHAAAGAVAGLVAFLPYPVAGLYVLTVPASALPGPAAVLSPAVVGIAASVAFVYAVGLSVLGSFLGRYASRGR